MGPYYGLTSSLKAVEWFVRRFHANIHNTELMILTALPYFQHPVFVKVLNVIPKQTCHKYLNGLWDIKIN